MILNETKYRKLLESRAKAISFDELQNYFKNLFGDSAILKDLREDSNVVQLKVNKDEFKSKLNGKLDISDDLGKLKTDFNKLIKNTGWHTYLGGDSFKDYSWNKNEKNVFFLLYANYSDPVEVPEEIYHQTDQKGFNKIKKSGFTPRSRSDDYTSYNNQLYFDLSYPDEQDMQDRANKNKINYYNLIIDTSKILKVKFYADPENRKSWIYTYTQIPFSAVSKVETYEPEN